LCTACHNNGSYTTGHLDGRIQLSLKLNNYSGAFGKARYNSPRSTMTTPGMVFFNQTSIPILSNCSNVNCHFERITPTWGSGTISCSSCHGAPPAGVSPDFSGGSAGSHARHDSYYNGTDNCIKCHSDHTADSKPYAHATSAGRRSLAVAPRDPQNNPSGTYSIPDVINYLPSQANSHSFGSCSSLYCHSPGTRSAAVLPPNKTAIWGGSLGCDGCHQSVPATGSHAAHVGTTKGLPVPCYKCHAATVTSANAITSTERHVNMKVDVAFDSTDTAIFGTYSGQLSPLQKTPGSGYSRCGNVYCHSSGQGAGGSLPPTYSVPKWGDPSTGKCGTCHAHGLHNSGPLLSSGSHTKHLSYDFGTGRGPNLCGVCHYGTGFVEPDSHCAQCHSEPSSLTTKHVNHRIDVDFVSKFGGTYNGTPEPGDGYSTCSSTYCHSNGTSISTAVIPANTTVDWGTSGILACTGCHEYPPAYKNGSTKANSHAAHSSFGCNVCHAGTTTDGVTVTSTVRHVNKIYDLQPGAEYSFTYSFSTGGGTCSSISCHFSNSATWGATLKCADCHATSPGDQSQADSLL
jgi:predicted CxxxxCH...CXXCH cytochrome family protein